MMIDIKREQFIWAFQNHETIPSCYENVFFNNTTYTNKNATASPEPVLYVSLVPTYLNYTLVNHEQYNQKKISHKGKDGAGMLIDGKYTVDSYLQEFTKRQLRVNLKRAITRLEGSFNITYEYNFGSITEEKYLFLLYELESMLEKRFLEKNMENIFLKDWELHTKELFNLINSKKASFFVIYSDEKPISISLNTHIRNNILCAKTNAFDMDYAKFSLGHLDNYMLLGWCLENNYHFLDLGFGIMDYKMKWCNLFYDFEYHIYSKKKSFIATSMVYFESAKIKLKNYIKTLKLQKRLQNIKSSMREKKEGEKDIASIYNQEILEANKFFNDSDLKEINIKDSEFKSIRQPIYDYLYTSKLHIDTIKTYTVVNEKNTFVFKAGDDIIKINRQGHES